MTKQETIKELNDFVALNSVDINNLYINEPQLGEAFNALLNAISKEYGSGEIIEIKQPEVQPEVQPISNIIKVGDKVKIPLTKSSGSLIEDSKVIQRAKSKGQNFLYVSKINEDYVILNDHESQGMGDYFSLSKDNIELYEEPKQSVTNFKIGDKVKLPLTKSAGALDYDESAVIRNAKKNKQDYLFVNKIDKDIIYLTDGDTQQKTDMFSISKDNIQLYEDAKDFSKMSIDDLKIEKELILEALKYLDEEDPEYKDLQLQLEEIKLYL